MEKQNGSDTLGVRHAEGGREVVYVWWRGEREKMYMNLGGVKEE